MRAELTNGSAPTKPHAATGNVAPALTREMLGAPTMRDPRSTSLDLHAHLRGLIIAGELAPGTVLKQAELARMFDVSRTPLREAFRMLQEEGLIESEANQRARVRALDAEELEMLYASRITLEALGARMSTGQLTAAEIAHAHKLLVAMDQAWSNGAMPAWRSAHRLFHQMCTARATGPLARAITVYGEQSERYLSAAQRWHPDNYDSARLQHAALLAAVSGTDPLYSARLMAEHLAATAHVVLCDLGGDPAAPAVAHAVWMASTATR